MEEKRSLGEQIKALLERVAAAEAERHGGHEPADRSAEVAALSERCDALTTERDELEQDRSALHAELGELKNELR